MAPDKDYDSIYYREDSITKNNAKNNVWYPIRKINEKFILMVKNNNYNFYYSLMYIHSFHLFNIKNLSCSHKFNIEQKSFDDTQTIAEKLRHYRYQNKLLQKDIAKKIGISESTYVNYENSDREYYPIYILKKIANFYKVDVKIFLDAYNLFLYKGQGSQLKSVRKKLKLTQKEFSIKFDVDRRTIESWENEKSRMSKAAYDNLLKIKKLL